jgi:hypothetical protein
LNTEPEFVGARNRFRGSLNVYKFGLWGSVSYKSNLAASELFRTYRHLKNPKKTPLKITYRKKVFSLTALLK